MNPDEIDIQTVVDDLVHQFSDPLAFVRELVQNSLDAGTGRIEVDVDFEEPDDGASRAVIDVRDFGEGMDRQIIEGEFLRLFSSRKTDDLTKVGQFGIGFVSVFAIEPDEVVVETGRHGEYWRVVFDEDRSWELYELERPVEGTTVRIYRQMNRGEFNELKSDVCSALRDWCKFARIPVLFEGRDVREDFDVSSRLKLEHHQEGTRLVMGMTDESGGPVGYYNRGLTLREKNRSPWPWVTYRLDSRRLDHTLTRDRLLEDRHFNEAMELLGEFAEERLPELLVDRIRRLVDESEPDDHYGQLCEYLRHYLACDRQFRPEWTELELFCSVDGQRVTSRQIRSAAADGRVHLTRAKKLPGDVVEDDQWIFTDRGLAGLFREIFGKAPAYIEDRLLVPRILDQCEDPSAQRLKGAVRRVMDAGGWTLEDLIFVSAEMLPSWLREEPGIVVASSHRGAVPADDWERPGFGVTLEDLGRGWTLIVNTERETTSALATMADGEPEWAAWALLESLFAPEDADASALAVEKRNRRLGEER